LKENPALLRLIIDTLIHFTSKFVQMTKQDTSFPGPYFTPLTPSDLDDLLLALAGQKAIMETYYLDTQQAYLEWMEASKKKRGRWLAALLTTT